MRALTLVGCAALLVACASDPPVVAAPIAASDGPQAAAPAASAASTQSQPPMTVATPPRGLVQVPMGTAAGSFASYMIQIHSRIHPHFVDEFLVEASNQAASSPLNDKTLGMTMEIVIARDGSIARLGVLRTSGVTDFDVRTLAAVMRARPFPSPPPDTLSEDGNFYVDWLFLRDEVLACNVTNASPHLFHFAPARSE